MHTPYSYCWGNIDPRPIYQIQPPGLNAGHCAQCWEPSLHLCLKSVWILMFWGKWEGITLGPAAVTLNDTAKWLFRAGLRQKEELVVLIMRRGKMGLGQGQEYGAGRVSDGLTGWQGSREHVERRLLYRWDKPNALWPVFCRLQGARGWLWSVSWENALCYNVNSALQDGNPFPDIKHVWSSPTLIRHSP